MGSCQSNPESKQNRKLEGELKAMKGQENAVMKILLLGAGESGKSTIFKQMTILHTAGYSKEDKMQLVSTVHQNCLQNAHNLIRACQRFGYSNPELAELSEKIENVDEHDPLTEEIGTMLSQLWHNEEIQKAYHRRSEYQLADSTEYFFKEMDRIKIPGYIPSEQDILRTRVRTSGIVEMEFIEQGTVFKLFDVGGQRNERRKWIHCFDNVNAVLFVAAISEYDQGLFEDEETNRLREALSLFTEICNSRFFVNTSMILFLNKSDLFAEKIKEVPLQKFFPEYDGSSYKDAVDFLTKQFTDLNKNKDKAVYTHVTCATNSENISIVFEAVKDTILTANLRGSGFM